MVKVMFLCTGNSCRSQIAEGFAKELGGGLIGAHIDQYSVLFQEKILY
jgi:protein-tyrosine-phosphatase